MQELARADPDHIQNTIIMVEFDDMKKIFSFVFVSGILMAGLILLPEDKVLAANSPYTFTRDLTVGSSGTDVTNLQTYLESKGYLIVPQGVSKGYFGTLTRDALIKYQKAVGITPAAGYFGRKTRERIQLSTIIPIVNDADMIVNESNMTLDSRTYYRGSVFFEPVSREDLIEMLDDNGCSELVKAQKSKKLKDGLCTYSNAGIPQFMSVSSQFGVMGGPLFLISTSSIQASYDIKGAPSDEVYKAAVQKDLKQYGINVTILEDTWKIQKTYPWNATY